MIGLLFDAIFLYIATTIALYLYGKTKLNLFLIGGTGLWMNGLMTSLGHFFGYQNMWIFTGTPIPLVFKILFIVFVALTYVGLFELVCNIWNTNHKRIAYIIMLLAIIPTVIAPIYPTTYIFTGLIATVIISLGYYWYKRFPKCTFDPFECG